MVGCSVRGDDHDPAWFGGKNKGRVECHLLLDILGILVKYGEILIVVHDVLVAAGANSVSVWRNDVIVVCHAMVKKLEERRVFIAMNSQLLL